MQLYKINETSCSNWFKIMVVVEEENEEEKEEEDEEGEEEEEEARRLLPEVSGAAVESTGVLKGIAAKLL